LFARFIIWPIIMFTIIYFDRNYTKIYDQNIYNILIILSIVPLAANTVVIASIMNIHPDKAACAVVSSMIVALFYMPLIISLFVK
ncbi:MAG: permease, partial [Rickettsiales bacterium]